MGVGSIGSGLTLFCIGSSPKRTGPYPKFNLAWIILIWENILTASKKCPCEKMNLGNLPSNFKSRPMREVNSYGGLIDENWRIHIRRVANSLSNGSFKSFKLFFTK